MKTYIAIILAKLTIIIGKILKKGSVYPGSLALKIDKNIMSKFKLPKTVIAVTGSSGKGSTTKSIVKVLRNLGYKVAYNEFGSNLRNGIITLLLKNCSLSGKVKKDAVIFEIDEGWAKIVFEYIKPTIVVITNITRDQPPRHGHFDLVYEKINSSLTNDMKLIINADDPYLQKFNLENRFNITYYGINKNKYSYKQNKFSILNINYCPKCGNKLNYKYYNFETLGEYYCSNCNFERPFPKFVVTNLDYDKNEMVINNKYKIKNCSDILYTAYNTLAAFTTLNLIGINEEDIVKNMSNDSKTYKYLIYQNRECYIFNNKNENASSFNQSVLFVDNKNDKKTIIIGWKEISRRYKFNDLSWLYDIEFELLNNHDIDKVICIGINRYDIATRIKLSGINTRKIKTFETLENGIEYAKEKTKGNIYAILNFDYVMPFYELMNEGRKK